MPTVLLVRHGQASFGAPDYDVLSDTGRQQAQIVADSLAARGYRPARLVSGTLRRQRDTAAAFEAAAPALEIDARWDEYEADQVLRHHSPSAVRLEGEPGEGEPALTNRGFHATLEPALEEWIASAGESAAVPNWADFSAAGPAALADLTACLGSGETGVAVTSGGTIAVVVGTLLGAPAQLFGHLNRVLVNASVTKLAVGATGTNLVSFNDHSHLEAVDRALVTYR